VCVLDLRGNTLTIDVNNPIITNNTLKAIEILCKINVAVCVHTHTHTHTYTHTHTHMYIHTHTHTRTHTHTQEVFMPEIDWSAFAHEHESVSGDQRFVCYYFLCVYVCVCMCVCVCVC